MPANSSGKSAGKRKLLKKRLFIEKSPQRFASYPNEFQDVVPAWSLDRSPCGISLTREKQVFQLPGMSAGRREEEAGFCQEWCDPDLQIAAKADSFEG
jgi:hypothetical protein